MCKHLYGSIAVDSCECNAKCSFNNRKLVLFGKGGVPRNTNGGKVTKLKTCQKLNWRARGFNFFVATNNWNWRSRMFFVRVRFLFSTSINCSNWAIWFWTYIAGSSACIIYVCTEMERREKNKVTVYVCVCMWPLATHFCPFVRLRGNFIVNNVSEELKLVVCHCLSDDIGNTVCALVIPLCACAWS